jgi:hypothetical protein
MAVPNVRIVRIFRFKNHNFCITYNFYNALIDSKKRYLKKIPAALILINSQISAPGSRKT